jgi:hypothetical protein
VSYSYYELFDVLENWTIFVVETAAAVDDYGDDDRAPSDCERSCSHDDKD